MLVEIKESSLSDSEKITGAFLRRYYAVDTETGAHLSRSYGRSKSGNGPKWFLILPLDGQLFDSRASCERATFRAWGLSEAIAIANEKLPKLLKRREKKNLALNLHPTCTSNKVKETTLLEVFESLHRTGELP
jgi:hypothetical protein